jgi:hypothetical protein
MGEKCNKCTHEGWRPASTVLGVVFQICSPAKLDATNVEVKLPITRDTMYPQGRAQELMSRGRKVPPQFAALRAFKCPG